jgi:DNA-binding PadR family transcriptional regulator
VSADDRTDPAALLPLSPPVFAILLTLGSETMHGYRIMQEVERRTEGRETLLPGSMYATIARMVQDGLIGEMAPPPAADSDRRRRFYRATAFGRAVARAEADRMQALLRLAAEQQLIRGDA